MIRQYLGWKSGRASENTVTAYTTALRLFSQWLSLGGVDPSTDTADALPGSVMDEYIVWMRRRPSSRSGQPISAGSVALYHAAVVDLFKYAARRGWLPSRFNWVEMKASAAETLGTIPMRQAQFDRRIPLLVAYVDQLSLPHTHLRKGRAHLELLRDRGLMHLLLSSGMSNGEVVSLDRSQIEDASDDSALIVGRGGKERLVFWDAETRKALDAWLAARRDDYLPLFIRLDNHRGAPGRRGEGWRLSAQNVWKLLTQYGRPLGIDARPQAFRNAMASAMLENDAPIPLVQKLLGYSSATVTRLASAAYDAESLRQGFDRYRPRQ
jgi:site-specific recombinase XerD